MIFPGTARIKNNLSLNKTLSIRPKNFYANHNLALQESRCKKPNNVFQVKNVDGSYVAIDFFALSSDNASRAIADICWRPLGTKN